MPASAEPPASAAAPPASVAPPAARRGLFLVFAIDAESLTAPIDDPKKERNGFTAEPLGAYVAADADKACSLAAKHHGRSGVFAAIGATVRTLEFEGHEFSAEDEQKLTGPPADYQDKLLKAIEGLRLQQTP